MNAALIAVIIEGVATYGPAAVAKITRLMQENGVDAVDIAEARAILMADPESYFRNNRPDDPAEAETIETPEAEGGSVPDEPEP